MQYTYKLVTVVLIYQPCPHNLFNIDFANMLNHVTDDTLQKNYKTVSQSSVELGALAFATGKIYSRIVTNRDSAQYNASSHQKSVRGKTQARISLTTKVRIYGDFVGRCDITIVTHVILRTTLTLSSCSCNVEKIQLEADSKVYVSFIA